MKRTALSALALVAIAAACGDHSTPLGPDRLAENRAGRAAAPRVAQCLGVTLNAVYSGPPNRPAGSISLEDQYLSWSAPRAR